AVARVGADPPVRRRPAPDVPPRKRARLADHRSDRARRDGAYRAYRRGRDLLPPARPEARARPLSRDLPLLDRLPSHRRVEPAIRRHARDPRPRRGGADRDRRRHRRDLRAEPARAPHLSRRPGPLGRSPRRHGVRAPRRQSSARRARLSPGRRSRPDANVPVSALTLALSASTLLPHRPLVPQPQQLVDIPQSPEALPRVVVQLRPGGGGTMAWPPLPGPPLRQPLLAVAHEDGRPVCEVVVLLGVCTEVEDLHAALHAPRVLDDLPSLDLDRGQ